MGLATTVSPTTLWDLVDIDPSDRKQLERFGLINRPRREPNSKTLTVLSFGGGQDSVALLLLFLRDAGFRNKYSPGPLWVVMSDTGAERPATYEEVERSRRRCIEAGIPFTFLTSNMGYHTAAWQSLHHQWTRNTTVGAKSYPKTCSVNLKTSVVRKFLNAELAGQMSVDPKARGGFKAWTAQYGPVHMIIGYAAGEERRVSKRLKAKLTEDEWILETFEDIYPLIDMGWDRGACQRYIRECGEIVPEPSCCMTCPYASSAELLLLSRRYRPTYEAWVQFERKKLDRFGGVVSDSNHAVFKTKTLPEVLAQAEIDYADWTDAQLYEHWMTHGHSVAT